jgi:DNA-binding CsgD family transcriptional regulator
MKAEAIVRTLNTLDEQLCGTTGIARSADARTLDQAIEMAAATTDQVLATGTPASRDALTAFLQAQVEAHEVRAATRVDVVRSLTEGIRRMRTAESLQRLGRQARSTLCDALGFDHALLSFVEDDGFVVEESEHGPGGPTVIPRRDCLPERECIRTRDTIQTDGARVPVAPGYRELLGAGGYLVAPVIAKGRVVALLHVNRGEQIGMSSDDSDVLDAFASAYSLLWEKILNAEHLQQQRSSIARAAARLAEEADRIATAAISFDVDDRDGAEMPVIARGSALTATLSNREREVFERLVLGASNADIAIDLVITIETVKTHVKRVLRKIGAVNRSEAIALYLDEAKAAAGRRIR